MLYPSKHVPPSGGHTKTDVLWTITGRVYRITHIDNGGLHCEAKDQGDTRWVDMPLASVCFIYAGLAGERAMFVGGARGAKASDEIGAGRHLSKGPHF